MGRKKGLIIITVAILSIMMSVYGNDILKGIVSLLLGIPVIILIFDQYIVKKQIKKQEIIFDICVAIIAVTSVVETILKIVNYLKL